MLWLPARLQTPEATMKLTHACAYAVLAVVFLARQQPGRLVASRQIAASGGLPERFLVKVLKPLVSARLLDSLRGPNGGYRLARPAKKITLLQVVEAVEGPIHAQVPFLETEDGSRIDRRLETVCTAAADLVRQKFARVRMADLAGRG
jgi:Rrf2 family protein